MDLEEDTPISILSEAIKKEANFAYNKEEETKLTVFQSLAADNVFPVTKKK